VSLGKLFKAGGAALGGYLGGPGGAAVGGALGEGLRNVVGDAVGSAAGSWIGSEVGQHGYRDQFRWLRQQGLTPQEILGASGAQNPSIGASVAEAPERGVDFSSGFCKIFENFGNLSVELVVGWIFLILVLIALLLRLSDELQLIL